MFERERTIQNKKKQKKRGQSIQVQTTQVEKPGRKISSSLGLVRKGTIKSNDGKSPKSATRAKRINVDVSKNLSGVITLAKKESFLQCLQQTVSFKPMASVVMPDPEEVKKHICTNQECQANSKPHRHRIIACKDHPYCVDDALQEHIPLEKRLPMPLPFGHDTQMQKTFVQNVEKSVFAETGARTPGTKVVVTQESLDNYWAQQWNLDIDKMPASLPDKFDAVQKLFQTYIRRGVGKTVLNKGSKQTLAHKMKQWSRAECEKRQRDLEYLYLKSNQDPKIYDLLEKKFKINPNSGNKKRVVPIGKYTPLDYFKLDSPRDQIPMVYPETKNKKDIEPIIEDLNQDHNEIMKKLEKNPGARFADIAQEYFEKKQLKKEKDYKRKIKGEKSTANDQMSEGKIDEKVQLRMESKYLRDFMMQSEIQELAERHVDFQALLNQRKDQVAQILEEKQKEKQLRNEQSIGRKTAMAARSMNLDYLLPHQQSRQRCMSTLQTQKNVSVSNSIFMPTTDVSSKRPASMTTHYSVGTKQRPMSSKFQTISQVSRPRLFSPNKQCSRVDSSILKGFEKIDKKSEIKYSKRDAVSQATFYDQTIEHAEATIESKRSDRERLNRTQHAFSSAFNTRSINQSRTSNYTEKQHQTVDPDKNMFTITVKFKQPKQRAKSSLGVKSATNKAKTLDNRINTEPSISVLNLEVRNNSQNVIKDLVEDEGSHNNHIQKLFNQAKWQEEKDQLIDTMAVHLQKSKPIVKLTKDQEAKVMEVQSYQIQGQSLLQKRLEKRYGMQNTTVVKMPKECQQYLNEAPILLQNKKKEDEERKKKKELFQDVCLKDTKAYIKGGQYKKSQEIKARIAANKIGVEQQLTTDKTDRTEFLKLTTASTPIHGSTVDIYAEEEKKAPKDLPPNSSAITKDRFDFMRNDYLSRVDNHSIKFKKKQAKANDPFREDTTDAKSSRAPSPSSISNSNKHQDDNEKALSQPTKNITPVKFEKNKATEPQSPGVGGPVEGNELKKVKNEIFECLNTEIQEKQHKVDPDLEIKMPQIEWDTLKLNMYIDGMDNVQFWLQKGLQQVKINKLEAGMDYFKQGLRIHPSEHILIYALAVTYTHLKLYQSAIDWFSRGIEFNPRWVDGLYGIAIVSFNMQDFERALKYISLAKENSKGNLVKQLNKNISYEKICIIHATCLKMTLNLKEAACCYTHLEDSFRGRLSQDIVSLLWGLILVPLSDDRKLIADHFKFLQEHLEHVREEKMPEMDNQNLLLTKYCKNPRTNDDYEKTLAYCDYVSRPNKLDFDERPKSIWALLNSRAFFKRFTHLTERDQLVYNNIMRQAQIELFGKNQIVFVKDRVGIVMMGSVEIRRHSNNDLMKPYTIKKAIEGDIFGWGQGDGYQSTSPLAWFVSMQNETEVVFIKKKDWLKLWNIQNKFVEQQIVLYKLLQNKYFSKLNLQTQYHLVYESVEMKVFFPGQLIMSIHERSPLCEEYKPFYNQQSKFRKEIEQKILKQNNDNTTVSKIGALCDTIKEQEISSKLKVVQQNIAIRSKEKEEAIQKQKYDQNAKKFLKKKTKKRKIDVNIDEDSSLKSESITESNSNIEKSSSGTSSIDTDIESNSTDYGLHHANQIIQEKAMIDTEHAPLMRKNFFLEKRNKSQDQRFKRLLATVEIRDRDKSEDKNDKRKRQFRSSKVGQGTLEVIQMLEHPEPEEVKVQQRRESVIVSLEHVLLREASIRGYESSQNLLETQENAEKLQSSTTDENNKFSFLIKKQIGQIQSNANNVKDEIKRKKKIMYKLLTATTSLESDLHAGKYDNKGDQQVKRMLTKGFTNPNQTLDLKKKNSENTKNRSTGILNQLLGTQIQQQIKRVLSMVKSKDGGETMLYQAMAEAIEMNAEQQGKRVEASGVHIIISGEALVVGKSYVENTRLYTLDAFGMCNILRKSGPEFLGDIRAGVRQVQTLYFPYDELKKRISITERIKLRLSDQINQRFEATLQFVAKQDNFDVERLRHF